MMARDEWRKRGETLGAEQASFGEALQAFAAERWPDFIAEAEAAFSRNYLRVQRDSDIFSPWALFHDRQRGRTVLEEFLSTRDEPLSSRRFELISAELAAWLSYWEVKRVGRRKGIELVDLLTGEEAHVCDAAGERTLRPGWVICARVVRTPEVAVFGGVFPQALARRDPLVQLLVEQARLHYGRSGAPVPVAVLRGGDEPLALLNCWRMVLGLVRPSTADPRPRA